MTATPIDYILIGLAVVIAQMVLKAAGTVLVGVSNWIADRLLKMMKVEMKGEPMVDYSPLWELFARLSTRRAIQERARKA